METATNDVIDHPHFRVTLERGAELVPGKIGNAVLLRGRGQYVDIGEHMEECLGNIEKCKNGITISMWINARRLRDNSYFLSSPSYSLYYKDRELKSNFASAGKSWKVGTPDFNTNQWHNVLLSWEPSAGLSMYIDEKEVAKDLKPEALPQGDDPESGNLYIGKSSDRNIRNTADASIDDLQYWYANIERLRAHGLFGGKCNKISHLLRLSNFIII